MRVIVDHRMPPEVFVQLRMPPAATMNVPHPVAPQPPAHPLAVARDWTQHIRLLNGKAFALEKALSKSLGVPVTERTEAGAIDARLFREVADFLAAT
jgi:hypothetical protein